MIKIETIDDLRKVIISAQGGNPEAQQSLNDFLRFKSTVERSNLPTRKDVQLITYCDYASKVLFNGEKDNPFEIAREAIATAFMAKGGDKSKQFVELMKQTPNLVDLQSGEGTLKRSLTDKLLGRNKPE